MRLLILILMPLFISSNSSTILTGIVSIDNEAIGGCHVHLLGDTIGRHTDYQGRFKVQADAGNQNTLVIELEGQTPKVIIGEIQLESGEYNFETIPLVYNKIIEIEEYEKLMPLQKLKYNEIRCWTELLGYMSKTSVDTTTLRKVFWLERGIRYQYDTSRNEVFIKFKDWRK